MSRRSFLRGAAAGLGGGIAFPCLTASRVVGAPGKPPPSDQVRMGHIGVGGMGGGHYGAYCNNDRMPSVAVCDVDARARQRAARRSKFTVDLYNDFRRLTEREDIDAVVVATPDHWHALTAIHALESGKDVYCEKPLSLAVVQGRKMVAAARRYGRVFQVGSQQRSSGEFRKAVSLCRSGRIGDIHKVYVNVGGPSREEYRPAEPVPQGFDWNLWLGPAPWRPYNSHYHPFRWRSCRDFSGGGCTDWGAHHMDIALWGIGRERSGPLEVQYDTKTRRFVHKHPDDVVVEMQSVPCNGVKFFGTEGIVEVNRGHFRTWPREVGEDTFGPGDDEVPGRLSHRGNWHRCMVSRERPVADVEIGHRTITACHLGNISYWLGGRRIRWDPDREAILGDPEASLWLDRPMRAPWHL
ncbi:MAG: Gfo/Idh/MocA family protein [Candidatus Brocadiia bacterium]